MRMYLVSLCLQGIVERSSLLKLLVELIHFLLMLLLQTLPLLLKLCQILETHQKPPPQKNPSIYGKKEIKWKMIFPCFDVHLTLWCCFSSSLVRCWCCSLLLSAFCLWHLSSSCSCFSLCSAPDACHRKTYAAVYPSFALYDTSDIT